MIKYENANYILTVEEQEWDSSIFGFKCGHFSIESKEKNNSAGENLDVLINDAITQAKNEKYKFLTSKINAEKTVIVNACFKNNGRLIDTELTFHKFRKDCVIKNVDFPENISVQKHKKYWNNSFTQLSKTIMHSRFFIDGNINIETAKNLWSQSIYNSCNGRATYSVICFFKDNPVGLINVFERDGVSDIFFIAVLPDFQNHGIGKTMVKYYEANIGDNISTFTVETQLINYRAQNFYVDMGYRNILSKQIIHFWLN